MKKFYSKLHSKTLSYIFFALAAAACGFLDSAKFAYGWIAEIYPLGKAFIPVLFAIIMFALVVNLGYLLILIFANENSKIRKSAALKILHTVTIVLSAVTFLYTLVILFGLDSGINLYSIANGMNALSENMPTTCLMILLPLASFFGETPRKSLKTLVIAAVVASLLLIPIPFSKVEPKQWEGENLPEMKLTSKNILTADTASISFEMLCKDEEPDAQNILLDNDDCWTPQAPNRKPAEGCDDINNSFVELKFKAPQTFNTAVIEEVGNEVQYFRLQALVNGEWVTVYRSEKIQLLRLCSFDAVTTDCVRLSIDKFRSNDAPAEIKSLKLFNEQARNVDNFEVTAYQRLDGDVPTEILAKGEDFVNSYARYYDVYSTVIVFAAVVWDENANLTFGSKTEDEFAAEIAALKEIIAHRSNPDHEVKLIITALADGAWGDGHNGVNGYMAQYWEKVADQIVEFVDKYDFAGVDIDWEYPATEEDWQCYNNFIARLDDGMNRNGGGRILSAALSAGGLGMSKETLDRFDQIQFMAYDGCDEDGYQSSLQQAQAGLEQFILNGADISKINIGIAAYGRPVNGSPYWATWRDLEAANYWDSKYYSVPDADQIYDGTFCSPALAGDKTAYALFTGCGGVMVFRVACDKTMDSPNAVACGIENALGRYINNW